MEVFHKALFKMGVTGGKDAVVGVQRSGSIVGRSVTNQVKEKSRMKRKLAARSQLETTHEEEKQLNSR